jgi:hypothetical protein
VLDHRRALEQRQVAAGRFQTRTSAISAHRAAPDTTFSLTFASTGSNSTVCTPGFFSSVDRDPEKFS